MIAPKSTVGRILKRAVFYDGDSVTVATIDEMGRPTEIKYRSKVQPLNPSDIRNPHNRALTIGSKMTRSNGYFYPTGT